MCGMRIAESAGPKKVAKNRHLGTIAQLSRAISSQPRHAYRQSEKNLLSSNISSTCPHNMVNFGPLVVYSFYPITLFVYAYWIRAAD